VDAGAMMEHVRDTIRALEPADSDQRWLADQALQISTSLLRQRWLMIERAGASVRPSVIAILVSWNCDIHSRYNPQRTTVRTRSRSQEPAPVYVAQDPRS
jgi:hypothetical protein